MNVRSEKCLYSVSSSDVGHVSIVLLYTQFYTNSKKDADLVHINAKAHIIIDLSEILVYQAQPTVCHSNRHCGE